MENERNKTDCPLIGQDGNVFNLIGIASKTLKNNGMTAEASEMSSRVFASCSYDEALSIIGEYVNITSADKPDEDIDEEYEEDFGMEMS
ncbi:MAG: hypothetical protein K2G04_05150 [Oscillospiraceae bacterium]|nr:hypothetical protein [Oscillospiraceae bacterium]